MQHFVFPALPLFVFATGNLLWPYIRWLNAKLNAMHIAFSSWLSDSWLPGLLF